MSFSAKVGNFTKLGGPTTGTQAITGVGFTPKVLILWTFGGTSDATFNTNRARWTLGYAVGTAAVDQFSHHGSYLSSNSSHFRRSSQNIFCAGEAANVTTGALSSFDSDGFTINWTVNNVTDTSIVHYLALAGTEVSGKVLEFGSPAGTGNFSRTGAGFQPNLVLLTGQGDVSLDVTDGSASPRLGAFTTTDKSAASAFYASSSPNTIADRGHDVKAYLVVNVTPAFSVVWDFVSMDADGFTMNQTTTDGSGRRNGALCLNVPHVAVGKFQKSTGTAPVSQSISGLGFSPTALLLFGDQFETNASPSATGAKLGIGGSDGTTSEAGAMEGPHGVVAASATVRGYDMTGAAYVKIDNNTGTIDAVATLSSFDAGGFTLNWTTNDAIATEISYIALGPSAAGAMRGFSFFIL